MTEQYKVSLKGFDGGSSYIIEIRGLDSQTLNELKVKINPCIKSIISDGEKRFNGEPVVKPCGCGESG